MASMRRITVDISQNTIYAVAYKLGDDGKISEYSKLVGKRRTRVYYHLEPKGKKYLNELMENFTITRRSEDSLFVDLQFIHGDPKEAMLVANTFAEIACEFVPEVIPYAYARVTATASKASLNYPQTTTTTVIAGLLGAVIAYAIVFVVEYTNSAIKGEEEFMAKYNVPLLGTVPDFENAEEDDSYNRKGGRKYYGKKY